MITPEPRDLQDLVRQWHQQRGRKGAQLLLNDLELQRKVTAQGGVAAADDQPAVHHSSGLRFGQGRLQGMANPADSLLGCLGIERTRIGQQKQQR